MIILRNCTAKIDSNYEEGCRMATSSFSRDFTLDSKKAVDSFAKIISTPTTYVKLDRTLTSPENKRRGETKLKQMLSR